MTRVLQAVNAGLNRARVEHDSTDDVVAKRVPKFQYGIIVSALRKFEHSFSHYYRQLFQVHPHSRARDIYAFASLEAVKGAVQIRDRLGLPIVGFDLAGEEAGFPAEHHLEAFDYAHRHFLKKTVHAGEIGRASCRERV